MSVFQRNNIWYVDYYPEGRKGKRVRLPLGKITRREALENERSIRHGIGPHDYLGIADNTIENLWSQYLSWIDLNKDPATFHQANITGSHFARILKNVYVTHVTEGHIDIYKRARKGEGVKHSTINKELSFMSGFMNHCRKRLGIDLKRVEIEYLKADRPIPLILSPQECIDFLKACDPFYRAFFGCCYLAGLRRREASRLRWEDLDYENCQAIVHGKRGKWRLMPFPLWLFEFIDAIKPKDATGYIFVKNHKSGEPVYWISTAIRKYAKKANIKKKFTCHTLRHCFATHLLDGGVNLRTIMELLGHSKIEVTQFYTQISIPQKRMASDMLMRNLQLLNVAKGRQHKKLTE